MIGAVIGSSLIGASAASKAAKAQTAAAQNETQLQEKIYSETTARFDPYYSAGKNALAAYNYEMGLGDKPTGYGGYTKTPGYDFALKQGTDAVQASAAAKGGLNSGAAMKALTQYGQDYATNQYGTYMNRLAGISDSGQAAAANQASAGANYAAGATNAMSGAANATSAGYIGTANALTGGLQNMIGIYNYQNQLGSSSSPWKTGTTAGVGIW